MRGLINFCNMFTKDSDVSKNPICRRYISGRTVVTEWTWHMGRCLRWRVGNRRLTTTISMITIKLENTPTFRAHISYKLLIMFSQYLIVFVFICGKYVLKYGARGAAVRWGTALQAGSSPFRFLIVSLEFFVDVILSHYGPRVDSACNRNGHEEYFLRGKGARCVGLTTLPL